MSQVICFGAEVSRDKLWKPNWFPMVPTEARGLPSPLILDEEVGKDPDGVGAGHIPLTTWGLCLASFWEFWACWPLGQCLDQMQG